MVVGGLLLCVVLLLASAVERPVLPCLARDEEKN
jgi:hypothetical protein